MRRLYLLSLLIISTTSVAKDFGQHGSIFPILEADIIEVIEQRLKNSWDEQKSLALKEKMLKQLNEGFNQQSQFFGRVEKNQVIYFDPSVEVKDPYSNEIETINPLDYDDLARNLLLIDGNNIKHLQYVTSLDDKQLAQTDIILVSGNPLELSSKIAANIYFDYQAKISQRFNIKFLPSLISQANRLMKIEYIALKEVMNENS
jgi:conjugal transfer pilus assembly protein TraW